MSLAAPLIERLETVDSTNDEAKRRLAEGAQGPLWIRADTQTAGRGRRGRAWASARGNLHCSGLFRFSPDVNNLGQLCFVAGLAAAEAVEPFVTPGALALKWPNDLLLHGAKTSGILLESGEDGQGRWLVIGIGVNLVDHPPDTPYAATHVGEHLRDGKSVHPDPDTVLARLAEAFQRRLEAWRRDGFSPVRRAWLNRASGRGRPITVRTGREDLYGVFEDLDESGALSLRQPDGDLLKITAGDVFFAPSRKTGA